MTDHHLVEEETTYCEVHPDRETGLRCNKCDRYMCAECAVQTPIGYRCRQCVRQTEDRFYSSTNQDYIKGFAVAAGMGIVAGALISLVSFLLLAFILAFPVGGFVAEVSFRAIQRRRGRQTAEVIAGGFVVGAIIGAVGRAALRYQEVYGEIVGQFRDANIALPPQIPSQMDFIFSSLTDLGLIAFIALAAFAVYTRIKM